MAESMVGFPGPSSDVPPHHDSTAENGKQTWEGGMDRFSHASNITMSSQRQ